MASLVLCFHSSFRRICHSAFSRTNQETLTLADTEIDIWREADIEPDRGTDTTRDERTAGTKRR